MSVADQIADVFVGYAMSLDRRLNTRYQVPVTGGLMPFQSKKSIIAHYEARLAAKDEEILAWRERANTAESKMAGTLNEVRRLRARITRLSTRILEDSQHA